MEMHGERLIQAPMDTVWSGLNDPDILKICLPGCEKVEQTAENQFAVAMAVKVGPVGARFTGRITLSDILPVRSYRLAFEGQGGAAGFGKGSSRVTLNALGGGCQLSYAVQAQVGGKIAQLGQRLIDSAAKSLADDFFRRFDEQMQLRHPPLPAELSTQTAGTGGAVGWRLCGMPLWGWVGGGLALVAFGWLAFRG